ncbi:uncharacterized protein LOC114793730 [Denticeps clupeoides]|uniref:uncharacterized protein LOC114793730 n=1 Tax=Denticeps clupeoides TaxID=299321 RepID=UPI0010A44CA5|nr:uncharacterized protein LOC114793730 [Denticeps clupeoides]
MEMQMLELCKSLCELCLEGYRVTKSGSDAGTPRQSCARQETTSPVQRQRKRSWSKPYAPSGGKRFKCDLQMGPKDKSSAVIPQLTPERGHPIYPGRKWVRSFHQDPSEETTSPAQGQRKRFRSQTCAPSEGTTFKCDSQMSPKDFKSSAVIPQITPERGHAINPGRKWVRSFKRNHNSRRFDPGQQFKRQNRSFKRNLDSRGFHPVQQFKRQNRRSQRRWNKDERNLHGPHLSQQTQRSLYRSQVNNNHGRHRPRYMPPPSLPEVQTVRTSVFQRLGHYSFPSRTQGGSYCMINADIMVKS